MAAKGFQELLRLLSCHGDAVAIGKAIGVDQGGFRRYSNGKYQNLRPATVTRIARNLGLPLRETEKLIVDPVAAQDYYRKHYKDILDRCPPSAIQTWEMVIPASGPVTTQEEASTHQRPDPIAKLGRRIPASVLVATQEEASTHQHPDPIAKLGQRIGEAIAEYIKSILHLDEEETPGCNVIAGVLSDAMEARHNAPVEALVEGKLQKIAPNRVEEIRVGADRITAMELSIIALYSGRSRDVLEALCVDEGCPIDP